MNGCEKLLDTCGTQMT